jgi:hypothetical protein
MTVPFVFGGAVIGRHEPSSRRRAFGFNQAGFYFRGFGRRRRDWLRSQPQTPAKIQYFKGLRLGVGGPAPIVGRPQ